MIFIGESLSKERSKLFDCAKCKSRYLTELSHMSMSGHEDWDDTDYELLVFLLNKVVENWKSHGNNDDDLVEACVAQTGLSISFDNENKSIVFLSLRKFLKEGYTSSFMSLNITVSLNGCDKDRNQTQILKGCRE